MSEENLNQIFTAFSISISLLGIAYLLFSRFVKSRQEAFRQTMFDYRDGLFDDALDGKIAFDNDAYILLRQTLNGYIRQSRHLTFWDILFFKFLRVETDTKAYEANWQAAMCDLSVEQQTIIKDYREKMHTSVLFHVLVRSPELYPPLIFITIGLICSTILEFGLGVLLKPRTNLVSRPEVRHTIETMDSSAFSTEPEDSHWAFA